MEKFRKWDDSSCAINPFTPLPTKDNFSPFVKILRFLLGILIVSIRIPCLLLLLFAYRIFHSVKYLFGLPILVRFAERLIDNFLCKLFLQVFSYNATN